MLPVLLGTRLHQVYRKTREAIRQNTEDGTLLEQRRKQHEHEPAPLGYELFQRELAGSVC